MCSTSEIINGLTTGFLELEEVGGNLVYGLTGILKIIEKLQSSGVLNTLSSFGFLLALTDIVKALSKSYLVWNTPPPGELPGEMIFSFNYFTSLPRFTEETATVTHAKSFITCLSSSAPLYLGYELHAQAMLLNSLQFTTMCGGLAIKALGEWSIAAYEFMQAEEKFSASITEKDIASIRRDFEKKYKNAKDMFMIKSLNLIGWSMLWLSQLTPAFLVLGFTFLIVASIWQCLASPRLSPMPSPPASPFSPIPFSPFPSASPLPRARTTSDSSFYLRQDQYSPSSYPFIGGKGGAH